MDHEHNKKTFEIFSLRFILIPFNQLNICNEVKLENEHTKKEDRNLTDLGKTGV